MVKSVYESNFDAIKNIMELYGIEQFDLDCTYSKGNFWKNLPQPKFKSDLYPINDTVLQSSSENLPFENKSMKSVMYDPPFIIIGSGKNHRNNKEGSSIMAKRFEGYGTYDELKLNYFNTLNELYRIVDDGGFELYEGKNFQESGKYWKEIKKIIETCDIIL